MVSKQEASWIPFIERYNLGTDTDKVVSGLTLKLKYCWNESWIIDTCEYGSIFIIYICLKQNYIKQYKSLQTNPLFSGYRIL